MFVTGDDEKGANALSGYINDNRGAGRHFDDHGRTRARGNDHTIPVEVRKTSQMVPLKFVHVILGSSFWRRLGQMCIRNLSKS